MNVAVVLIEVGQERKSDAFEVGPCPGIGNSHVVVNWLQLSRVGWRWSRKSIAIFLLRIRPKTGGSGIVRKTVAPEQD